MVRSDLPLITLRKMIESGQFASGSRLPPERELATKLGISRAALRQMLVVLESEGKIWRHVGRGTFVGDPPTEPARALSNISRHTSPAEVFDVRLLFEPPIAAQAASRASEADIANMERCLQKLDQCYCEDDWRRVWQAWDHWDAKLHRSIALATHNELLLALFDALNAIRHEPIWGRMRILQMSRSRHNVFCRQHRKIIRAIAQRNSRLAEQAMAEHIRTARDYFILGPEDPARHEDDVYDTDAPSPIGEVRPSSAEEPQRLTAEEAELGRDSITP